MTSKGKNNYVTLFRLARQLSRWAHVGKLQYCAIILFSTLAALSEFATLAVMQPVISMFSSSQVNGGKLFHWQRLFIEGLEELTSGERILSIIGVLLLLQVMREFFLFVAERYSIKIRTAFEYGIRQSTYQKVLHADLDKVRGFSSGDMHSLINSYPRSASGFVFSFLSGFPTITMLIVYIAMMFTIDWRLLLLVISFSIIIMLFMRLAYRLQVKYGKVMREGLVQTGTKANEIILGLDVVRSFGQEQRALSSYLEVVRKYLTANRSSAYLNALLGPLQRSVSFVLIMVSMVGYYFFFEIDEGVFFTTLILFIFILARLNGPLTALNMQRSGLAQLYPTIVNLLAFLTEKEEKKGGRAISRVGQIKFDNVSFSYGEKEVLDDILLQIDHGNLIGIVGPSGAGKTTLINILSAVYIPQKGSVLIDGIGLQNIDLRKWRSLVSVVSQRPFLFEATVKDNIKYGNPHASDEDVCEAARLANAAEFVEKLPQAYDTFVGENGKSLSGGQIQRLAIARALLVKPQVLILDEATSAQDTYSEDVIKDTLKRLQGNVTCIVIAHRLSTIVDADSIVVMKQGRIVEMGVHNVLLSQKGLYSKLYKLSQKKDETIL